MESNSKLGTETRNSFSAFQIWALAALQFYIVPKMGVLRTQMCLAIAAMLMSVAMAVTYTVGSPNGSWDTSTNLQAWATSKSFSVGDNLGKFLKPFLVFKHWQA